MTTNERKRHLKVRYSKAPLCIATVRAVVADWAEGRSIQEILDADDEERLSQDVVEACIRFALLHPDKLTTKRRKRSRR